MFAVTTEHEECKGTGLLPHPNPGSVTCYDCHGHKVISRSSHRGYANATTAERAIAGKKATQCWTCKGTGTRTNPDTMPCYGCKGGIVVSSFAPGDVIPDGIDLYGYPTREAQAAYAAAVTILVRRHHDKTLTRGIALLGLGTVYTCVDYGAALRENDDAKLLARVREHIGGHEQLCKFADKETRTVAETVVVDVTTGGYTVTTEASLLSASRAMLPPTYTAEVLNAPVD